MDVLRERTDIEELAHRLNVPYRDVEQIARNFEGDTWSFIENVMDLVASTDAEYYENEEADLTRRMREDEDAPF